MNQKEHLFHVYAYFAIAISGSLLLYCIFIAPFNGVLHPLFQIPKTQVLFGVITIACYMYLIAEAGLHFIQLRQQRDYVQLKLYAWRDELACDFSAPLWWDFVYTLWCALLPRFIPFLLLCYASISFIEACIVMTNVRM